MAPATSGSARISLCAPKWSPAVLTAPAGGRRLRVRGLAKLGLVRRGPSGPCLAAAPEVSGSLYVGNPYRISSRTMTIPVRPRVIGASLRRAFQAAMPETLYSLSGISVCVSVSGKAGGESIAERKISRIGLQGRLCIV